MQSVTKSVMSVTIGVARTRGEFPDLDTPILKFFDASKIANVDEHKRRITIRHLLTMSAGMDFNEKLPCTDPNNAAILMEASHDWVQFAMDRPMSSEPGTVFAYSSGASQILSHIFKQATGRDIQDYARQHLFTPLGITEFHWKRTPTGLTDTEGGLYLRAHDLAKIGYLFLKSGRWDGRQIDSADWVKMSVTPSIAVDGGPVQYGFQWWLTPYGDEPRQYVWEARGLGGQRLYVLPEREMILVFTGWNILTPPLIAREAIHRMLGAIQQPACSPAAKIGYVLKPGEGEKLGPARIIKASPKSGTQGGVLMIDELPPGFTTGIHVHTEADEFFYVISGRGTATFGEKEEAIGPGDVVFVDADQPIKLLFFLDKPGIDDFFREAHAEYFSKSKPLTFEACNQVGRKYAYVCKTVGRRP